MGKTLNSEVKFKSMLGDAPYKSTKGVKRMSVSQADTDLFAVIPDTRWVLSPPPKKCKIKWKDFYFVNFFLQMNFT